MWRALILSLIVWAGPVLAQQDDPGVLTRFLQNNLSSAGRTVQITGFQGALSSRATIQTMTIADAEGVWLTLNGVTLDWNRAAVLRGRFSVNELVAQEIIVARPPVRDPSLPAPEAKGFSLPELPVSVEIGKVAADRLELGAAVLGMPVEATLDASLRLVNGEGQAKLSLLRMDSGPAGKVTLDASYSNTSRLLVVDLDAEEAAGGIAATELGLPGAPATRLTVKGQGIIDDFAAEIGLATDGVDRLAGQVTLASVEGGRAFTAKLAGDPAPLFLPEQAAFFGHDVRLDMTGQRSTLGFFDLSKVAVRTEALTLDGALRLAPDGLPQRIALTGQIARDDGAAVVLPTPDADVRVNAAQIALNYDVAKDDGWTGSASLQGLVHPALALDQALVTGSGRIHGGPEGDIIGGTLRLAAAGVHPTDPAQAAALGQAVTGQAKVSWQQGKPVSLSDLTVAGSDYTVQARGRITGLASGFGLDGRLTAEVADLARFSGLARRPLGGRAEIKAEGQGSVLGGDFDLTGSVQGEALRIGQAEVDNLLRGPSQIAFSVARTAAGTEVRSLDLTAASLAVTAEGWLRTAGSDLSAKLRFDDLAVLGRGYRGSLSATATFSGTPEAGTATLDAAGEGLAIGQLQADRVLQGKSTLSAALRTQAGTLRIERAQLTNPQLTVEATGRATGATRQIDIAAKLADLGILLPDFPGALTVSGTAVDDGAGYRLDLRGTGPGKIDARVAGRLAANAGRADLTLKGTALAALANAFIVPRTVAGPVSFDLRLTGPLALNSVSGRIALTQGRIAAPALRLAFDGVSAQADLAGGQAAVTADARLTTGGRLGVRGTVGLTAPFPGDLTISARDLLLRNPELYEVHVTGDVRVTGPLAGGARISGVIRVPEAEIQVPSTDIGGAGAIPDLTHRNEPAAVRATRARAGLIDTARGDAGSGLSRPFQLDLTIEAPNQIFVRGRGLDAELGGTLQLRGTTEAVVPSGGIDLIRGRLDILGRRLDLSEAQIRMEGSLDPSLRVVASTYSDRITSSVVISGRISEPEISFTSSPELPEEEVLAHLLFGRELNSLSPLQAAQLANAVATLAGRGGEGLIGKLRRSFGLDDFDLVNDSVGGTSLRLGRYIAKNVYTEVIVGTEGKSQLNLNLDVRPGVTVRGSADSKGGTGIGIFVERDY